MLAVFTDGPPRRKPGAAKNPDALDGVALEHAFENEEMAGACRCGGVAMSRYLSTQHWRSHNASDALLEVRERLRGQIEPTNKQAPWLYSQHLLGADDNYGSLAGLVVQGTS